jgi:hypothetical protein
MAAMNGEDLKRMLREAFDARVFNYGDFNLVYGQPSGAGNPWVIGYRHQPLELLLCPVDLEALPHVPVGSGISTVALGNVATLADTGSGYQVETVTGFRTWFEVSGTPRIPLPESLRLTRPGADDDGTVVLGQEPDAEDFHQFMSHFMDTLESYY